MGTWGTGIFQNDISDDVRRDYKNKLKIGKTDEKALEEIIQENRNYIEDSEDCIDFWFGLASVMFDLGRLTNDVRHKALGLISDGDDIMRWIDSKEKSKRIKELELLQKKLLSQQPERKIINVKKPFDSKLKENDILLYYSADIDKYIWLAVDKLCLFDTDIEGLGDMLPVTFLKISNNYSGNISEVNNAHFIMHCYAMGSKTPEYRYMWYKTGFKHEISRFRNIGNFHFDRPNEYYQYPKERFPELRYASHWNRLNQFIEYGFNFYYC